MGFLKLERQFFDHWLWEEDRPYSKAEAWIDLLRLAAFKPCRKLVKGQLLHVPRGSLIASERFLSNRWNRGRSWVRTFIVMLASEGMVQTADNCGQTMITLLNYDRYNDADRDSSETSKTPGKRPAKKSTEPVPNHQKPAKPPDKTEVSGSCRTSAEPVANQYRTSTEPKIRSLRNTRTTAAAVERSPSAWPAAAVVEIENMLRDFGKDGVQYVAKATNRQQQLGRSPDDVRSMIVQASADGVKDYELAKHLIHGSKLPPARTKRGKSIDEAEKLWKALHRQWAAAGKPCAPGELRSTYESECERRGLVPV